MQNSLLILLFLCATLEGFGIPSGHEASLVLITICVPVIFVYILLNKNKKIFPFKISVLFGIFLLSSFLSSVISSNIAASLSYSIFGISLYLAFLYAYNFQEKIEKPIIFLIYSLSLLFTLYSLLLNSHHLNLYIPSSGYQFVFSKLLSHNNLGDFLVLPVIISLYNIYNKKSIKIHLLSLVFFTPFVFLSYSRSAFLSIALALLVLHLYSFRTKHSSIYHLIFRILIVGVLICTMFFILSTSRQAQKQPLPSKLNSYLVKKEGLSKYKDITGYRPEYIHQAILSVQKNPIFGVGPANFLSISKKYATNSYLATDSAHNIFLEILVGQGVAGFIPFVLLIAFILKNSKKELLFFVFLAILINFQTHYSYQIYSFLLLFFIITGFMYEE